MGATNLEPAHIGSQLTVARVNAAADLPIPLMVWTVVDVLDVPDHLRVTAGNTELATMPIGEAEQLGPSQAATELGRRARAAYEAGTTPTALEAAAE